MKVQSCEVMLQTAETHADDLNMHLPCFQPTVGSSVLGHLAVFHTQRPSLFFVTEHLWDSSR